MPRSEHFQDTGLFVTVFPGRVQCSEDGSTVFAGGAKLLAKGKSKNDRKVFTCESLRLSQRTSETIIFLSCSSFSPAHVSGIGFSPLRVRPGVRGRPAVAHC